MVDPGVAGDGLDLRNGKAFQKASMSTLWCLYKICIYIIIYIYIYYNIYIYVHIMYNGTSSINICICQYIYIISYTCYGDVM